MVYTPNEIEPSQSLSSFFFSFFCFLLIYLGAKWSMENNEHLKKVVSQ